MFLSLSSRRLRVCVCSDIYSNCELVLIAKGKISIYAVDMFLTSVVSSESYCGADGAIEVFDGVFKSGK